MFKYHNELKKIIADILLEEDVSLDEIDDTADLSPAEKRQREEKAKSDEIKQKREDELAAQKTKREADDLARKEKQEAAKAELAAKQEADKQAKIDAEAAKKEETESKIEDEKSEPEPEAEPESGLDTIDGGDKSLDSIDTPEEKSLSAIESELAGNDVEIPDEPEPVPDTVANYSSLAEYRVKAKTLGTSSNMQTGYYYTFDYYFDKSTDDISFNDTMPLTLIYDDDITKDGKKVFWGFNFHTCDIDTRNKILGEPIDNLETDDIYPKSAANFDNLEKVFPPIKKMVRQYRADRMKNIRKLGPNAMRALAQYTASTYYRKSYTQVVQHFNEK